jgi:hypothetical protein
LAGAAFAEFPGVATVASWSGRLELSTVTPSPPPTFEPPEATHADPV